MILNLYKAIINSMAFLFSAAAFGQDAGYWGTWNNFNLLSRLNNKLSIYYEGQVRAQKLVKHYNYYEMNLSAGYTIAPKTEVQLGVGRLEAFSPTGFYKKPVQNDETRLWEQIDFANTIGVLRMDHRYRLEQQFTSGGYHNRLRYRLNFVLPIHKKSVEKNTFYLNCSDEIFLRDREPYFNQNRLYLGAGYQLSKRLNLQMGWMRVGEYAANNTFNKNFLLTSLITDLTFKKEE